MKKRKKRASITVIDFEQFIKDQRNDSYLISFFSLIKARKEIVKEYKNSFDECITCSGKGFLACGDICPVCSGFGLLGIFESYIFKRCQKCGGSGFIIHNKHDFSSCDCCNGTGILDWIEYLTVGRETPPQPYFRLKTIMRGI